MLRKLTGKKSNKKKRDFIERKAMDPCEMTCEINCDGQEDLLFMVYDSLYY